MTEDQNYRKRPNFFSWFYDQGVHEILEIWKNFLVFVWHFFSIYELFITLLDPWRRDVSIQSWRGWHPILRLQLIVGNIFSRLIGAVVRLFVIFAGLICLLFVLIFGLAFVFLWISAPLAALVLALYVFNGTLNVYFAVSALFLFLLISIYGFFTSTEKQISELELSEIHKHPAFERISQRFGLPRKNFPDEIFSHREKLEEFLKMHGLSAQDFDQILDWELNQLQENKNKIKFWHWQNLQKNIPIGLQWRFGYTVNLDRYSSDLSQYDASDYSNANLIGRDDEYEVFKLILQRPDQNCLLLVGGSGVGKKTLIHELGRKIRFGLERGTFRATRLLLLDLGRAISDAINRGEDVENFLRMLFYEASYAGNIILVIEHLEHFLGNTGSTFRPDISVVLSEFLDVPSFQIIATSTPKEYHQLIEKEQQIIKYFEVVEIREPDEDASIKILLNKLQKFEKQRILFTYKALKTVVSDSGKHNWQFPLPERALDLAMDVLMYWEKKSDEQFITEKIVADYLSLKTGVKHGEIEVDERKKLLNLEQLLHRQVIGQNEAIGQVSEALRRARSGIGNSQKPVGSFLFLGPTGVGKTETAKALAKIYFGDENHMIRLDMSEFQSPNSIDRLLGSSQLNQQGRLVTKIKDNPYSLLLLDEIEKAYPEILDIFLQILDEGYVTDAFGEKINFRNCLIIATSNAGAALIKNMVEQKADPQKIQQAVVDWAIENGVFRTEFLNRFEGVIFFKPLDENELVSVVKLQLQKFARKLAEEKNINISFGESIVQKIIENGYNPIFGARSINRYIEGEVEGIVAKKIIAGELVQGQAMEIDL